MAEAPDHNKPLLQDSDDDSITNNSITNNSTTPKPKDVTTEKEKERLERQQRKEQQRQLELAEQTRLDNIGKDEPAKYEVGNSGAGNSGAGEKGKVKRLGPTEIIDEGITTTTTTTDQPDKSLKILKKATDALAGLRSFRVEGLSKMIPDGIIFRSIFNSRMLDIMKNCLPDVGQMNETLFRECKCNTDPSKVSGMLCLWSTEANKRLLCGNCLMYFIHKCARKWWIFCELACTSILFKRALLKHFEISKKDHSPRKDLTATSKFGKKVYSDCGDCEEVFKANNEGHSFNDQGHYIPRAQILFLHSICMLGQVVIHKDRSNKTFNVMLGWVEKNDRKEITMAQLVEKLIGLQGDKILDLINVSFTNTTDGHSIVLHLSATQKAEKAEKAEKKASAPPTEITTK